jgi:hypothetical protein
MENYRSRNMLIINDAILALYGLGFFYKMPQLLNVILFDA